MDQMQKGISKFETSLIKLFEGKVFMYKFCKMYSYGLVGILLYLPARIDIEWPFIASVVNGSYTPCDANS